MSSTQGCNVCFFSFSFLFNIILNLNGSWALHVVYRKHVYGKQKLHDYDRVKG